MQITQQISDFVAATKYSDIPDAALRQAKASITDWLFVALAGRSQFSGPLQEMCEQILSLGARPQSSLIGRTSRTSENHAALVNGVVGHVLDYDETCPKVRSHLFASIFPALLAAAEARGLSGAQLLSSFVIG